MHEYYKLISFFFLVVLFLLPAQYLLSKNHEIEMLNKDVKRSMVFKPSFLKVEVGDTITFIPTSKGHNTQSVFTPERAKSWKGKVSKKKIIKLKEQGVYIYECTNHSVMGMNAIIQVGNAVNLKKAKSFLKKYKNKIAIRKNRIDQYFKLIEK